MNEQDLKSLYARWLSSRPEGDVARDTEALARLSLNADAGDEADEVALRFARPDEALAAYRTARELAPNVEGLARALDGGSARRVSAAVTRARPMAWAALAAAAMLVLVVSVERQREHVGSVAVHDVINAGSFEGDDPAPARSSDTLFSSNFDDG